MRILTVVCDLDVRGTQRAALSFTLAYQRAGHEVAVLAYSGGGPREALLRAHSVSTFVGGDGRVLDAALCTAQAFRPDVVHIHRSGAHSPGESRILSSLRRANIVIETNVFGRVDYSSDCNLVDVHLLISAHCLWRWQHWLGRRPQLGVLVPYPVEPTGFQRATDEERLQQRKSWGIPADAYVCGHVGFKLSRWVLDGFTNLLRHTARAWLVCIPLSPQMAEYVRTLPKGARERIVGVEATGNDAELQRAYSAFDCLLHAANIGESFGYVLAEAQLCGVPIVTLSRPHRDNAQVELVRHGVGGIVAGQPARFSDAIVALYEDSALRERVRQTGPKRMIQLYDADRVAGLALRAIELARAYRDPRERRMAFELDPHLRTNITDEAIGELLHNTLGGPSLAELALMRFVAHERGQQVVRLIRHGEFHPFRTGSRP